MPAKQSNAQPASPSAAERADLMTALHRAQDLTRVKSGLLASVSHELRTPLAGVMGFAELLLDSSLTPQQRSYVHAAADSGHAMVRLLNDLNDMAQIEGGKLRLTSEPTDLAHCLQTCVDQLADAAHNRGLGLTLSIDPALPAGIMADPLRLRQIIVTLIGNALKFTDRGGVQVTAQVHPTDHRLLSIAVADNDRTEQASAPNQIFGHIGQLPAAAPAAAANTDMADGGSGLGLSLSSELARLMGGRIEARSEATHSTTIRLLIPLQPAVLPPARGEAREPATPERLTDLFGAVPSDFAKRGKRSRVLVAEDNDINQQLILVQAERAGIFVEIVEDGAQAIEMVAAAAHSGDPYRLVLMDLRMPVMDGLEAARALRAAGYSPEDLPIVALSAHANPEHRAACTAAGMQDHIAKPMSNAALRSALKQWVAAPVQADAAPGEPPALSLSERYQAMKRETAALTLRMMRSDICLADDLQLLTSQLHKICGTAAYFDEAWLGTAAGELEQRIMRAEPAARLRLVSEVHQTLSLAD